MEENERLKCNTDLHQILKKKEKSEYSPIKSTSTKKYHNASYNN